MKYKIQKIEQLSGNKAHVYSIIKGNDENISELEKFFESLSDTYVDEVNNLVLRINTMGKLTGIRTQFIKEAEGRTASDGVCAIYDEKKKLRLYCVIINNTIVILGGGGAKRVGRIYEDDMLQKAQRLMIDVSADINARMLNGEIYIDEDGSLKGDLNYENYEE